MAYGFDKTFCSVGFSVRRLPGAPVDFFAWPQQEEVAVEDKEGAARSYFAGAECVLNLTASLADASLADDGLANESDDDLDETDYIDGGEHL